MRLLTLKVRERYILVPDSVLDTVTGRLDSGRAVTIIDGRIAGMPGVGELARLFAADGYREVPLPGITLMPGLLDCHVHLALDGVDFGGSLQRWQDGGETHRHLVGVLNQTLSNGIVAVRDGGDSAGVGLTAREQALRGDLVSPVIRASGSALRREGCYGTFLGKGAASLAEARSYLADLRRQGADQIKVLVSGIVSFREYGRVGPLQFTLAELTTLVADAHHLGLRVMAHASSDAAVQLAAASGADSIEHGYFVGDATLQCLADSGIAWVPTVVPVYQQTMAPWRDLYSRHQLQVVEQTYRLQLAQIRKAADWGVVLGIGTDSGAAGVPHGVSYHGELELMQAAGLSNQIILYNATVNGARILGLQQDLGSIEPGKRAYLIGVPGNPLADLGALRKTELVVLPAVN